MNVSLKSAEFGAICDAVAPLMQPQFTALDLDHAVTPVVEQIIAARITAALRDTATIEYVVRPGVSGIGYSIYRRSVVPGYPAYETYEDWLLWKWAANRAAKRLNRQAAK